MEKNLLPSEVNAIVFISGGDWVRLNYFFLFLFIVSLSFDEFSQV